METYLKIHATQLKQLIQTQTNPLHNFNAYSDLLKKKKATIFHNNEHTNIIITQPAIRKVEKTSNTITLLSPHNTSLLEKTTKLITPHPTTFTHQNITMSYAYKTGTAQRQQITTLAKLPTYSESLYLYTTMPIMLVTHMTLITFLPVVNYQHNTTPLVCGKSH